VAILGIDEAKARAIVSECSQGDMLVAANFNCPGQVVLSGAVAAVARASEYAKSEGLRAPILDVAGAFHSPFMQPAADALAAELAKTTFNPLQCTVVSNVTGLRWRGIRGTGAWENSCGDDEENRQENKSAQLGRASCRAFYDLGRR